MAEKLCQLKKKGGGININSITFNVLKAGTDQGYGTPTQSITNAVVGNTYFIYTRISGNSKPTISGIDELGYVALQAQSNVYAHIFIGRANSTTITVRTLYEYSFQEMIFE